MRTIFWKELRDHFSSWRFLILLLIILITTGFAVFAAKSIHADILAYPTNYVFLRLFTITTNSEISFLNSFIDFLNIFAPLIGIILGFDAINNERTRGTLSRMLSQPIFRDAVINGKFLAGMTVIAVMIVSIIVLVSALGVRLTGVAPGSGEIVRILLFIAVSVLYTGFWLGLGMLASIIFRGTITSAFITIVIWLFCVLFMPIVAGIVADEAEPLDRYSTVETRVNHDKIEKEIARISPATLYEEASATILNPERRTLSGLIVKSEVVGLDIFKPVSLRQSIALILPHLIILLTLTLACFGASYVKFTKEEIRST